VLSVPSALISFLHSFYILVEPFALFFTVMAKIIWKSLQVAVEKVNLNAHIAHQNLSFSSFWLSTAVGILHRSCKLYGEPKTYLGPQAEHQNKPDRTALRSQLYSSGFVQQYIPHICNKMNWDGSSSVFAKISYGTGQIYNIHQSRSAEMQNSKC
jgi:hypothetical protein